MGLPVGELVVATNENDIVSRFFNEGKYHREEIQDSISPSMDICVSSNFERYLYYLSGCDCDKVASWMSEFDCTRKLTVTGSTLAQAQSDFKAARVDTASTLKIIRNYLLSHGYMLCPHSAVGVGAIEQLNMLNATTVCLATASHAKFPDACGKALENSPKQVPEPPDSVKTLFNQKGRFYPSKKDIRVVHALMKKKVAARIREDELKSYSKYIVATGVLVGFIGYLIATRRGKK